MTDFQLAASLIYDGFVEDGRVRSQKRAERIIEEALRRAFVEGQAAGRSIAQYEIARATGLCRGLSFLKGPTLIAALRKLASGGRVTVVVEGDKKPGPELVLRP
jgi:hypothetical protein